MKTLRHHPRAGSYVGQAIKEMVAQARREHCLVRATFNDVVIQAAPNTSVDTLFLHFTTRMGQGVARWHQSREYAQQEAEGLGEIVAAQATLDNYTAYADIEAPIKAGLASTVDMLAKLIPAMDVAGVVYPTKRLTHALLNAGYINNDLTGYPSSYFNTPWRMGRYIVGQAINCMVRGMPPHPILVNFINQYRTLCEKQNQPA